MKENKIGLKPIGELLGMRFFIPSYQRGYRWVEQQVTDLLNDVNEFEPADGGFYCLQPLVVKKRKEDILSKIKNETESLEEIEQLLKGEWEVIDGQQRLTTIYIILSCLNGKDLYSLMYETRKDSANFLAEIDESVSHKNIDYHYIVLAKNTIQNWLSNRSYQDRRDFKEKLLSKVKFIWYESVDEDPIQVFTRLNIGKISLTNAELIKALFLNRSNFNMGDDGYIQLRQRGIASEWDNIEYALQDDEFWLFLHNLKEKGYDRPTRIDFIFDLICKQNSLELDKEKLDAIGTDEYKTFRYFYGYFKSGNPDIVLCWKSVKKYYQVLKEWYNDLELYHYVGYLISWKPDIISLDVISSLVEEWSNRHDKGAFLSYLKSEIKEKVSNPILDKQYEEDGRNKRECRPILLFHNIQTVINQNYTQRNNGKYQAEAFYKFPFHLYKLENWDVEHINSNTENPEDDIETQKEWLLNVYLSADDDIQEKISTYFGMQDAEKQKNFFKEIKSTLPVQEEWSQMEKNRIWNYALLDSSTNRSYENSIFSGKRRIIIGKDKGKLIPIPKLSKSGKLIIGEEFDAGSSFVPPCTKQVFLKYYSPTADHSNYWTKLDAEAYLEDIRECLKKLEE